jgi:hypothetical protein
MATDEASSLDSTSPDQRPATLPRRCPIIIRALVNAHHLVHISDYTANAVHIGSVEYVVPFKSLDGHCFQGDVDPAKGANESEAMTPKCSFLEQLKLYLIKVKGVPLLYESSNEKHIIGGEFALTVSERSSMWIG